jgi:hypothetical protein
MKWERSHEMTQPLRLIQAEPTPAPQAFGRPVTVVLNVRLAGGKGERWDAIGIGHSQEEALTWALESAPAGVSWLVCSWSDTYGS